MRILIAGNVQGDGGYEEAEICRLLAGELKRAGHTTDYFLLPYARNMLSLPEQILAYQLMQINDSDLLITVGYPACMLKHHNKICYLLQLEPMLAEYWDSKYGVLANYQYSKILENIMQSNAQALGAAKKLFVDSQILADDLRARYALTAKVLPYPVLSCQFADKQTKSKPYMLCETNLLPWQRVELLIELVEQEQTAYLQIFVPNADLIYEEYLQKLIEENKLTGQIEVLRRRAGITEITGAELIFIADYNSRRIPNILGLSLANNVPVVAMQDCGASAEILPVHNLVQEVNISLVWEQRKHFKQAKRINPDPEKFVEELLG